LAEAYASAGRCIHLVGRDAERLRHVQVTGEQKGAKVYHYICDVRDIDAMQHAIDTANQRKPLDLVIANAGVSGGTLGEAETAEQARMIFDMNVQGVLNTIHPAIDHMKKKGGGQLALMASVTRCGSLCGFKSRDSIVW